MLKKLPRRWGEGFMKKEIVEMCAKLLVNDETFMDWLAEEVRKEMEKRRVNNKECKMSKEQTQGWNVCKLLLHPCQQLEQQKPTVTREWLWGKIGEFPLTSGMEMPDIVTTREKYLVGLLNEAGVEVID